MGAVVVNSALTNNLTGNTVPVSMPADIVAQRLLLVEVSTMTRPAVTMPGWSKIGSVNNSIAGQNTLTCFAKLAAGNDTGSLVFSGGAGSASAVTYQISQWSGSLTGVKFAGNPNSTDAPKLAMGSSDDYLWLPFAANFWLALTSPPTNYTDLLTPAQSAVFYLAAAQRSLSAASEDPGAFGGNKSNGAVSATVGVSPGSVG